MTEPSSRGLAIRIEGLYKIFGQSPERFVPQVQAGMSKTELIQSHGHILGLRDINLDIPAGCLQVVMGLSGSGKSTLIRHINRLIEPTAGRLIIDGSNVLDLDEKQLIAFRRKNTAMVFQKFGLLPHRTVLQNAMYGLELQRVAPARRVDIAMHWLKRVGLEGFEAKYPNELSGGMQQRVGLARALCVDAPILLMDEAFSALDPLIRVEMQDVLLEIQREVRKTIIFITHDLDEALKLGDRIAVLRDGELVQQGTSEEIVLTPANHYIRRFVQEVNRGRVVRVDTAMTAGGGASNGVVVNRDDMLQDAARKIAASGADAADVVDGNGVVIGRVSLNRIVSVMIPNMQEAG
ncbi:quaternary amine ABC transporter ATP-binding protein [Rhizobium metallidurans]|uniref:Quaternary amine transport ATP-binding protein n=1 Tax=Rhizobium metallidurans TaxID=1265931 RepID=A0A7W6CQ47_9HYPH|nr:betaine/proline/choline family ABC transporter ATP-binding protein [Rhizobium metallidurans]MBB3962977.1 glycine betaine/proline transport system ATP-binding protein [Rhizobium metallidurans]